MVVYLLWFNSMAFRMVTDFVCWVAIVATGAAFVLSLMEKWHILEWLQVHAPNEFLHELVSCKFCLSWWVCVLISLILLIGSGQWFLLAVPVCATLITRELW